MRKEEISIEHLYTHIYDVDGIVNFCAAIKKKRTQRGRKLCCKDSDSNSGGRHSTTSQQHNKQPHIVNRDLYESLTTRYENKIKTAAKCYLSKRAGAERKARERERESVRARKRDSKRDREIKKCAVANFSVALLNLCSANAQTRRLLPSIHVIYESVLCDVIYPEIKYEQINIEYKCLYSFSRYHSDCCYGMIGYAIHCLSQLYKKL